jgi:hypothetical protein
VHTGRRPPCSFVGGHRPDTKAKQQLQRQSRAHRLFANPKGNPADVVIEQLTTAGVFTTDSDPDIDSPRSAPGPDDPLSFTNYFNHSVAHISVTSG